MRESYINVVGIVCAVGDTLLTYLERSREGQPTSNPRSWILTPAKYKKLKKNEGKVMILFLSTSETDINTFNRLPTLGTGPGRSNNSISIGNRTR